MNKLSAYKKIIYYALLDELGPGAVVDLRLHHHDAAQFARLIRENQDLYHYYVVMPHFYEQSSATGPVNIQTLLAEIPAEKLVLLDKNIPDLKGNHVAVYQDFDHDLYEALEAGTDLLEKYRKLILIFPKDVQYPTDIVRGFRNYAIHYKKEFAILDTTNQYTIESQTAYIVLEDSDLAELVRQARQLGMALGQDVGILAFNETPLKEVLANGITVVSTDHEQMGRTAAQLMLSRRFEKVKNPFGLIRRGSL